MKGRSGLCLGKFLMKTGLKGRAGVYFSRSVGKDTPASATLLVVYLRLYAYDSLVSVRSRTVMIRKIPTLNNTYNKRNWAFITLYDSKQKSVQSSGSLLTVLSAPVLFHHPEPY